MYTGCACITRGLSLYRIVNHLKFKGRNLLTLFSAALCRLMILISTSNRCLYASYLVKQSAGRRFLNSCDLTASGYALQDRRIPS